MPTYVGDALYAHAKGGCYRCLRGDRLVDLDAQIEGEGALVLCEACIRDAAEAAGITLNAAAVTELQAQHAEERRQFNIEAVEALRAELAETIVELENERAVVDRLMGKVYVEVPASS